MAISRDRLVFNTEKQLLINLITNSEYCRRVLPKCKAEYFNSEAYRQIISWVGDYYEQYGIAPVDQIQTIFEHESSSLDPDVSEQVVNVLTHLSNLPESENNNVDYLVDTAFKFFRRRNLELQVKAAEHYLSKGQLEQAEEALEQRFTPDVEMSIADRWDNEAYVRECVRRMVVQEDPDSAFFRYNGRLGDFIGNIDRGWFVSFLGPAKRGKTVYLIETVLAAITRRLNVVTFSLEMPSKQIYGRVMKSVTGALPMPENWDGKPTYTVLTPVFDCAKNQKGECRKKERVGTGTIFIGENNKPVTCEELPDWEVCTECRGTIDFFPSAWKVPIEKEYLEEGAYVDRVMSFMKLYGRHCRTIFHPSKSASVEDLESNLYMLEHTENFVPDVVVIDYIDLLKPPRNAGQKRHDLDELWEQIRAMGQGRQCLMVSASQTNRTSATAEYIKDTDVAEDYSKIAKLDLGIGLCQNDMMKAMGMMNINKIAGRHTEFIQSRTCTLLQELGHMQGILDSEYRLR